MPTVCQFDGIDITMYFNDHLPPHFHAFYGDDEVLIEWNPPQVHRGALPNRALRKVLDWAVLRSAELDSNWALARQGLPVHRIPPPP